jgi:hypothetical protein
MGFDRDEASAGESSIGGLFVEAAFVANLFS